MPIYEYACAACGHKFEEWQKMSDAPVRTCPKCKKKKVEKLISMTAFQLKGGGWYADLYSSSKPGGKDSGAEAKGGKDSGKDSGGDSGSDGGNANGGGGNKGSDSGTTTAKQEKQGANKDAKAGAKDTKDAKKKDSPKKSEARAA